MYQKLKINADHIHVVRIRNVMKVFAPVFLTTTVIRMLVVVQNVF